MLASKGDKWHKPGRVPNSEYGAVTTHDEKGSLFPEIRRKSIMLKRIFCGAARAYSMHSWIFSIMHREVTNAR